MTGAGWTLTVLGVICLGALAVYLWYYVRWRQDQKRKRAARELVRDEWDRVIAEFRESWRSE